LNEKATDLYQMLKVEEPPLDSSAKSLDMMCSTPKRKGELHDAREIILGAAVYIKTLLQSRISTQHTIYFLPTLSSLFVAN